MRSRSLVLMAAFTLSASFNAFAQQSTLRKLDFRNPGPYSQADLEAAAGVHAGQKLTLTEMQAAAQRLVDTGCFDSVKLDSKGSPGALTLIFLLQPSSAGEVHRIGFANFVWFTPDELMAIARKVAPLAPSGLPEGGGVLDAISDALQSALAAKGIVGAQVGHRLVMPSSAEPVSVIEYSVNKPFVVLNKVSLQGVAPQFEQAVQRIAGNLGGKPYIEGATEATSTALLRPYLDAGFLEAHLVEQHTTLEQQHPGVVGVDLAAKVLGGDPYRVSAIRFESNPVLPASVFEGAAKLHGGDVASEKELLASVEPIDTAYHKRGYMDEYVDRGAKLDTTAHTVSYDFKVVPGDVYRVHSVTVTGLSPEARAEFDQGWTMKVGQPYNAAYATAFVTQNTALRSLGKYTGGFAAAADPSTHLVDLTVKFIPTSAK